MRRDEEGAQRAGPHQRAADGALRARNVEEAQGVVELLAEHGLKRGENDLKLIMMCEIPVQRAAGRKSS